MGDIFKDGRFNKLINDPKYRQIPKSERKVKIDKRFQSMFESDKFKVKYTVDKRGRPVNQSSSENLKKYYDLSEDDSNDSSDSEDQNQEEDTVEKSSPEESDNENVGKFVKLSKNEPLSEPKIENSELACGTLPETIKRKLRDLDTDYARGEGVLVSDSSSEEESDDGEDELQHGWGELDADAETCEEATNRLAVCNMDWDNIKASDLFVLFNSFLPPGGMLKSVIIYPSEFGLKRMEEEELRGPIELTEKKLDTDSDDSEGEEGAKYHMEKLRQYQLNRLKYYYAVATFDSPNTANNIYSNCDGIEYESSAAKVDLRFIPDDVTFDQKIHDKCHELPDSSRYKPRLFTTTALQQAKVELTWDAVNPHRNEVLKSAADGDINNEDLKNYLACSSSSEDDAEAHEDEDECSKEIDEIADPIAKYKNLLQEIESSQNKKKNREEEMEISWGLGLKQKTEELVKKKINKADALTPFEELVEKKKEKKKAKKLERKNKINKELNINSGSNEDSDDAPSDVDMDDPYFAEEFDNNDFIKKKKTKKSHKEESDDENTIKKRAELELLLDDDENDGKAHFSLKKIQEAENTTKSKKKRNQKNKNKQETTALPDFTVDVNDERFSALYTSHHFNIDPTDSNYKKTQGMEKLIQEKLKRRPVETDIKDIPTKKVKGDAKLNVLVNSIKRKTGQSK